MTKFRQGTLVCPIDRFACADCVKKIEILSRRKWRRYTHKINGFFLFLFRKRKKISPSMVKEKYFTRHVDRVCWRESESLVARNIFFFAKSVFLTIRREIGRGLIWREWTGLKATVPGERSAGNRARVPGVKTRRLPLPRDTTSRGAVSDSQSTLFFPSLSHLANATTLGLTFSTLLWCLHSLVGVMTKTPFYYNLHSEIAYPARNTEFAFYFLKALYSSRSSRRNFESQVLLRAIRKEFGPAHA